jgi:DNA polymerase III gamma/tau subunit
MKELSNSFKQSEKLHHAYCIVGERGSVSGELLEFFEKDLKVKTIGNPDFWRGEFDSLAILDAREIREMQGMKAFGGNPIRTNGDKSPTSNGAGKKIFLILANKITREAQNALLKVFEEPTADTHFFLIMPSIEGLLPTLKSRLSIIVSQSVRNQSASFW